MAQENETALLRAFRTPGLSPAGIAKVQRLCQQAFGDNFVCLHVEVGFYIQTSEQLSDEHTKPLTWLLTETFEPTNFRFYEPFVVCSEDCCEHRAPHLTMMEFGPRMTFTSPFSSNAVAICSHIGLSSVNRIEKTRRFLVGCKAQPDPAALQNLKAHLHDRMTECEYTNLLSFGEHKPSAPVRVIPLIEQGIDALKHENTHLGLAMDDHDVSYYYDLFVNQLKRNPTDVELFDIAQSNSEHSRHWFFKGKLIVDNKELPCHLFDMVKSTLDDCKAKHSDDNSVVALSDNSSAIRGSRVLVLEPESPAKSSAMQFRHAVRHLTLTAETHNFPTGVAPFPGAETGTGGRIRDGGALGKGSLVGAGTAGYCVGNLGGGVGGPWEQSSFKYPENLAKPLDILVDASNGASDYGNKFGEPVVAGFTRSFGGLVGNERREWIKPIMFSGGIGQVDQRHTEKGDPQEGMLVAKIGGPAYRIGIGGGAASSMVQGDNKCELDFNAVQRGDAEMEQKMNRVVRACVELGDANPIVSIHDQGAGGNCNVVKEIVHPAGGRIDLGRVQVGDPSLSALEIWGAEYQENSCVLLRARDKELFSLICEREGCPVSYIGDITSDGRIVVTANTAIQSTADSQPVKPDTVVVDLPLEKVLGKMPQKTFELNTVPVALAALPESIVPRDRDSVEQNMALVLSLLDVGSKRFLTNKVDRSVTGLIAQQQCVGPLFTPVADYAVVAQSHFSICGVATSIGERPILGLINAASMARMTVTECVTNLMFVKIEGLHSVKCSGNWMWAAKLAGEGSQLVEACSHMCQLMSSIGLSIDGGKDSLSMAARVVDKTKSEVVKAPGTLVVSTYAPCPNITARVTPCLPSHTPVDILFVPINPKREEGKSTFEGRVWRLGASAFVRTLGQLGNESPDLEDANRLVTIFNTIQELLRPDNERSNNVHIVAGHDISDGGLGVAILEMCMAGHVGANIKIPTHPALASQILFSEEPGILVGVLPNHTQAVVEKLEQAGLDSFVLGQTTPNNHTIEFAAVHSEESTVLFSKQLSEVRALWEVTSLRIEALQADPSCIAEESTFLTTAQPPNYQKPTATPQAPLSKGDDPTANLHLSAILSKNATTAQHPKVAIIREEGSNGDREMASAFQLAGFQAVDVHMNDLRSGQVTLDDFRGVAFVGGFSYADAMDSAKGWAGSILLNGKLKSQFEAFRKRADTFSLGVCNGAQLMMLLGWVPSTASGDTLPAEQQPRFIFNRSGRYECRFTTVRVEDSPATRVMLKGLQGSTLGVWVAHGEGRAHFPQAEIQKMVEDNHLCAVKYVSWNGDDATTYPENPNGSTASIAALCSPDGRHLALMPHPERCFLNWQWPWTPAGWGDALEPSPWFTMFANAREWCAQN